MLRYKTKTRPGLVALYDIRPGNGAGQFLQPQSPHGALDSRAEAPNQMTELSTVDSQWVVRLYAGFKMSLAIKFWSSIQKIWQRISKWTSIKSLYIWDKAMVRKQGCAELLIGYTPAKTTEINT